MMIGILAWTHASLNKTIPVAQLRYFLYEETAARLLFPGWTPREGRDHHRDLGILLGLHFPIFRLHFPIFRQFLRRQNQAVSLRAQKLQRGQIQLDWVGGFELKTGKKHIFLGGEVGVGNVLRVGGVEGLALKHSAADGGVPVVLDGVVGAAGQVLGNESPLITESKIKGTVTFGGIKLWFDLLLPSIFSCLFPGSSGYAIFLGTASRSGPTNVWRSDSSFWLPSHPPTTSVLHLLPSSELSNNYPGALHPFHVLVPLVTLAFLRLGSSALAGHCVFLIFCHVAHRKPHLIQRLRQVTRFPERVWRLLKPSLERGRS